MQKTTHSQPHNLKHEWKHMHIHAITWDTHPKCIHVLYVRAIRCKHTQGAHLESFSEDVHQHLLRQQAAHKVQLSHLTHTDTQPQVELNTCTHTGMHTHITNTTLLVLAHKNPLRQQTHLLTVCSLRSGPHTQMSMTWVNKSLIKPSTSQLSLMLTRFLHFTVTAARKTHHRQRQRDEWACRQSGSSHVCEQNA